jgi:acyl dehydratase
MVGKTIAELSEGEQAELVRVVESSDLAHFVDAVGDFNPVHSDRAYAATTRFKGPIAPGIFTAGLISAVIGTQLPGPGAIYLSQDLKFLRPVRPGDTITARVRIAEIIRERNRIRLETVCVNQRGEDVLVGEAWVMPSTTAIVYERPDVLGAMRLWMRPWLWAAQAMAAWSLFTLGALTVWTSATAPLGRGASE